MDKKYSSMNFSRECMLMVNAIPYAVVLIDKSGSIIIWNRAAEIIIGYSADEILGKNFTDMIGRLISNDKAILASERFIDFITDKAGNESSFFTRGIVIRKDKLEFFADVSVSSVNIDGEWCAICIIRDISKQVESEFENIYLSNIVKSSNDAIIGMDLNQKIISWNQGAERIYGYSAFDILGKNMSVLVPHGRENEIESEIEKIKGGDSVPSFETERITKSNKTVNVLITLSPIKNKFDSIVGASVITTDITREKQMFNTMIRYISEAAMRLKTPAEMVRLNLSNIIEMVKSDGIDKENLILNLSIQMKNTEQIVHNLRELNQAIIGSYEEIPEDYIKYFKN
ncbi:MAG: PAS domain-containing protein [Methanomicrobiaceae archaeon]|nr:PAS domain-containing protein [Methanomicrobiaceae archaeon]